MKKTITFLFFLASLTAFAQNDTITKQDLIEELNPLRLNIEVLQKENNKLNSAISNLKTEVGKLKSELSTANKNVDSLQIQTQNNSNAIAQTANDLGVKITTSETNANQKITNIDDSLNKKSLYGIIGLLLAILLTGLLYLLLSKRQKTDKIDMIDQLSKTKSSIEESLVKEFGKQTDLIESQLQILANQKTESPANVNAELDHSLALKVADEITLIERNISFMDKNIKGLKQLLRSVQKLKDNLSANGYEIPELLGKQFNQGMKLIVVNSVPDENLQKGDEIISKIIKPQVNYDNKMIQPAQVEVSIG